MSISKRTMIAGFAAVAPAFSMSGASALDSRYTDADGDLVADMPTDPTKLIDPATLIFAYTPVEDPAVYAKVWDGFLKHIEKVPARRFSSSRCSRMPPRSRRCAPAVCTSPASTPAPIRSPSPAPASARSR